MVYERDGKKYDLTETINGIQRFVVSKDKDSTVCECVGVYKSPGSDDVVYRMVWPEFPGSGHMCWKVTWQQWAKNARDLVELARA